VSWDYTTWLNIVFLILAAALIIRFTRTGGPAMLRMMGGQPEPADSGGGHAHHGLPQLPGESGLVLEDRAGRSVRPSIGSPWASDHAGARRRAGP
jgi:hypothetical protein